MEKVEKLKLPFISNQIETRVIYEFAISECASKLSIQDIDDMASYAIEALKVEYYFPVDSNILIKLKEIIGRQYQECHLISLTNPNIKKFKLVIQLVVSGLLATLEVASEIERLK